MEKHCMPSVPSSLKTGAVRRYCRILRSLSKGHSTFFQVMNSITCLASSQNFCSTEKIDSVRDHCLSFVCSYCHTLNRCPWNFISTDAKVNELLLLLLRDSVFSTIHCYAVAVTPVVSMHHVSLHVSPSQTERITSKLTCPLGSLLVHPSLRK